MAGEIRIFGGASAPNGWLLCQGQSLLRTDYAALYAIIGTTFGSADGTHFSLPDLRDNVPVGASTGKGLGSTGGEATHTLTESEMPAHTHPTRVSNLGGTYNFLMGGSATGSYSYGNQTLSDGDGAAHNNIQPYQAINFIIKY